MDGSPGERQTLVIVGNGMMGFRLCRCLVECGAAPDALGLVVFGEEPRPAYDRIRLSELLAGVPEDDLTFAPRAWYADHGIDLRTGDPVVRIDRAECAVEAASGAVVPFDRLVLCTGSRAFVPPIPGASQEGVLVYRTVDDLIAVREHAGSASSVAVIGGGLLGIEAARAVQALGPAVHLVEASRGLMARQLDEAGARLLREKVEALGIHVHTGARTARIEVADRERAVCLEDGRRILADVVVLAAGIRPRGDLGRAAGLEIGSTGGVVVDDHLQSSDPRIFAVGECATHRGVTYGLLGPGYRMIDVLVDNLVGGEAVFEGADRSARLKLAGVSVAALGRYDEAADTQTHTYLAGGVYRKLVLAGGRIVGAISVGEWPDLTRVQGAIAVRGESDPPSRDGPKGPSFWDLRRFRSTGTLWPKSESPPVYEWPADALVCGCVGVRRGTLTEAEMAGCETAAELSACTGAGTVCGSCRPLLVELVQRARVDTLPPSRLSALIEARRASPPPLPRPDDGGGPVSSPPPTPTLRSLRLPPAPLHDETGPCSVRSPVFFHASGVMESAALPAPPSVSGPPSSRLGDRLGEPPPSSRRETLGHLRPVSVPPSRISRLSTGRLPLSVAPQSQGPPRTRSALLGTAAAALAAVGAILLLPALPPARSFRGVHADALWTARPLQQASGYAVVLLVLASLLLSLRKRWERFSRGTVAGFRVAHGALGALALVGLGCHTGLHVGERLNRLLSIDFLLASALGGAAAAATALGDPFGGAARKVLATRAHLLVLLPLPVLVVLHVLGAYYF